MGILAAVEYLLKERDSETEYEGWITSLETIAQHVTDVSGVEAEILASDQSDVPRLEIQWDSDRIGLTGLELREQLLCGDPRIMLDDRGATDTSIFILPFSLQSGEADIVGGHIRDALSHAPLPLKEKAREPIDVSGAWEIEIALVRKIAHHRVDIEQSAGVLTGDHQTRWLKNSLNGSVNGDEIVLTSQHRFEGTHLSYRFEGTVSGNEMRGEVEMGSSGQSAPGPLNQREYGTARWQAVRR